MMKIYWPSCASSHFCVATQTIGPIFCGSSEDNSHHWLGCYGNEQVSTPNIDQLAAEGCDTNLNILMRQSVLLPAAH